MTERFENWRIIAPQTTLCTDGTGGLKLIHHNLCDYQHLAYGCSLECKYACKNTEFLFQILKLEATEPQTNSWA